MGSFRFRKLFPPHAFLKKKKSHLVHLFALVLPPRPLSSDFSPCKTESIFFAGKAGRCLSKQKIKMPVYCDVALPDPVLWLLVFLGQALVLLCSITALWNLSINIQLDIKASRSQTSDLPLGPESNFAWPFCLLSIGIYFSNWCYIKC